MYVASGARLTYQCSYTKTGIILYAEDAGPLLSSVVNQLANEGLIVEDSSDSIPSYAFGTLKGVFVLKILNQGTDHSSEQDVRAIVDHAFYVATSGGSGGYFGAGASQGQLPDSSSILSVTPPNGSPTRTGAPEPVPSDNRTTSWWDKFSAGISGAEIGIAIGAVAVIGLLIIVAGRS